MRQIGLNPGNEIEFLRKNNNRNLHKSKRIRSIKVRSFHLVLIILIFIFTGYGAFKAGKFITGWDFLSVKKYKLINSPVFMKVRIEKILKKHRGNILSIDLGKLRRDLLTIKEVREVNISRRLPSTLSVTFFLRKPVFQFKKNGTYRIADREGVVISRMKKPVPGLINIKLSEKGTMEKINSSLAEISHIKNMIEYVTYKNPYGIVLKLKNFEELFYTGDKGFIPGIKRYLKLRKMFIDKENRLTVVDLRFRGRLYLGYEREVI